MHTIKLAEFAAALRFEDLPDDVRSCACDCIQDTIGVSVFGAQLPWGKIAVDYAKRNAGQAPVTAA